MSLPCLQGVLYVPQEVQDYHVLVHVTSEVSDTPVSQPLTAVSQSPRPMTHQYIFLRLPLYGNGSVYTYIRRYLYIYIGSYIYRYLLMLLLHCMSVHLSLKLLFKAMILSAFFCELEEEHCGLRGLMRVVHINMSEPCSTCPPPLAQYWANNIKVCRPAVKRGCDSLIFPVHGVEYNYVCGRAVKMK